MKKTALRISVMILTVLLTFSLTSCDMIFEIIESFLGETVDPDDIFGDTTGKYDNGGTGTENGGKTDGGDDNQGGKIDDSNGNQGGKTDDSDSKTDGKIEIKPDESTGKDTENAYYGLQSGYNIVTNLADTETHVVKNYYEGDRIVDNAVANHYSSVTVDYSAMGTDFSLDYLKSGSKRELGHVKISYNYYQSNPHVITYNIDYNTSTASYSLEPTPENTYRNYRNGNMLVRNYFVRNGDGRRSDDFESFAINTKNNGTANVYNTEELWWALEHNYLPVFPIENSKAEAIYNDAKDVLREIINDGMTDYDKALAIFEYLIDRVSYDYDAFRAPSSDDFASNACYYLEGVFEYNRAVCDGKSKAFVLLCRIEGIECVRDWGSSLTGGAGHAWNYVKLAGNWYMVDTTAGDAGTALRNKNGTAVNVEIADYDYFACPVNSYKLDNNHSESAYEYSGIWSSLLEGNDNNASLADGYFEYDIYSVENKDFIIDDDAELNFIVDTMIAASAESEYTLLVTSELDSNDIWRAADKAIDEYSNVTFSLYTGDCYILVFYVAETV